MPTSTAVACLLLVACGVLVFAEDKPLYVHFALTETTSSVVVSWMTVDHTNSSVVKFGTTTGVYTSKATGTERTYFSPAGYTHDVILTGLKPNTKYYYVCGDETAGFSSEFSFRTSANADQTKPSQISSSVAIVADFGVKNGADTAKRLEGLVNKVDFFYHVGDISYADDYNSANFEKIWNEWFVLMKNVLPYAPYMVSVGNHEHNSGQPHLKYVEYFKVYNYRFRMPSGNDNNMWYSFDYNGVHFVSISTETDYEGCEFSSKFGDQLKWLKEDLKNATDNRKNVPWIVVTGHRPMYTSVLSEYANKYLGPLRHAMEDILHTYQVDMFICGHVHNYERSYPMFNGTRTSTSYVNPSAPVHIVVGNAGCPEGIEKDFSKDKPEWSAYRYDASTGYGILTVNNANSLKWEFFRSPDGALEDSFTLTRK